MRGTFFARVVTLPAMAAFVLAGLNCSRPHAPAAPPAPFVVPPHVAGTVREYAVYDTGGTIPVQGYGIVMGLGKNGSKEVPDHLREYLVDYLLKKGLGSESRGTASVSPMRFLQDLDTAIVLVGGAIPFGAPEGARFDLSVIALPNTQTRSLQGGTLMPCDLRLDVGMATTAGPRVLAEGGGGILPNPFVDPNNEAELIRWREGRVLGGGRVTYAHPIHVQMRQPDYARANLVTRRINETFGQKSDVASARDSSTILVTVPRAWQQDYEHFLELVMHVPLSVGAQWEARSRELVRMMEAPDAPAEDIALTLEATGRNVVPLLRSLYTSRSEAAAFYAARAAARLGDEPAEEVLIRFARLRNSPFQTPAIEELGRNEALAGASGALQALIDDEDNVVRVAAYEALARRGDHAVVSRTRIDGRITLDLVRSRRAHVIYATQSGEARIALFGPEIPVATPLFFSPPDEMAVIRNQAKDPNIAGGDGEKLGIFRKMPKGGYTAVVTCNADVRSLIVELAAMPDVGEDGKTYHGLRLNYGEVLSVLYRMCQRGDIPAKFNLQSDVPASRIPGRSDSAGRSDVPGS
jgi:hypothetical protein